MESRDCDAQTLTKQGGTKQTGREQGLSEQARFRLRVLACCVLLVGVAFIQTPGALISDTKFDLATAPVDFLGRALHLWDDEGGLGQLQNQAYGYLWPMGPFFALGVGVGLPGWVVQRLWIGLVMVVAFSGTAKLGRELGVRSQGAVLVAGLAYATSPRMLSQIGPISIEVWPSALAPWVLVALVIGVNRGSARRAALLAGLGVGMVGGVNAVATFAVIPLGVVWLLTRERGPRRRTLIIWWPVFTLLATAWWLVPLFVMGAYSPPFLDYIETASVTTFPTTVFDSLRGTSSWVVYIDQAFRGGNLLIADFYLVLNAGIVMMLGLIGVMLPHPHRRFLVLGLSTGLLLVTMGHVGSVQGFFAGDLHAMLDGALAPLRNVHKFDPIIRLPLVLGLAFLIEAAITHSSPMPIPLGRDRRLPLATKHVFAGLALLGVVGAAVPAYAGQLAMTRPVVDTPNYWEEAAAWLDQADAAKPEGRQGSAALVVPGSGFGSYFWGSPRDEPMQWLAGSRWAVRNAIPLTPPGNIRMLNGIERQFSQGLGGPGLADYLRRAGIGYLVVRNDVQPSSDVPEPVLVQHTIANTPGLFRVAGFGPKIGGGTDLVNDSGRILINGGWREDRSAIEIYQVAGVGGRADAATRLPRVVGGPEDLIDLVDAGVAGGEPTELAMDADGAKPRGPLVLTDGLVERERAFARIHDGVTSARLPGDPHKSGNPHPDYLPPGAERWLTRARLTDVTEVTASSSESESTTPGGAQPGNQPFAALDGQPESQWISRSGTEDRDWWQVRLPEPVDPEQIEVTLGDAGTDGASVVVRTEAGETDPVDLRRGNPTPVLLPPGETDWIRIERINDSPIALSLVDVEIPGVEPRRDLVLPATPADWGLPQAVLVRRLADARTGCLAIERRTPCLQEKTVPEEEPADVNRVIPLTAPESFEGTLTAHPRPGPELNALLQEGLFVNVTGSSTGVRDPRGSGLAAMDGDLGTSWTPALTDEAPILSVNWLGKREITGVQLSVPDSAPVRTPSEVLVTAGRDKETVSLDADGQGEFKDPIRTDQLTIQITEAGNAATQDAAGIGSPLPIGVSEVRLDGLDTGPLAPSNDEREFDCGTGPDLRVNGVTERSRIVASPAELLAMQRVEVRPCDAEAGLFDVPLQAGENQLQLVASDVAVPDTLLLDAGWAAAPTTRVADEAVSPVRQDVTGVPAGDVLVVHQNVNPGWRATADGAELTPVTVDGWQQGFLPADGEAGSIRLDFAPDRTYRIGLLAGLVVLVALVLLLWPARKWGGADRPALGQARVPVPLMLGLGLATAGLLAGWGGLVAGALGYAFGLVVVRRHEDVGIWVTGSLLMVCAFGYSLRPWGSSSGWAGDWSWPHYVVVFALAVSVWVASEVRLPRSRRRSAGSSTNR